MLPQLLIQSDVSIQNKTPRRYYTLTIYGTGASKKSCMSFGKTWKVITLIISQEIPNQLKNKEYELKKKSKRWDSWQGAD